MAHRPLTRRQLQVLLAIQRSLQETGLAPTLRELGQTLGVNRVTAYSHVQALLQKGCLTNLEPGASRGLELTDRGRMVIPASLRASATAENGLQPAPARASVPILGRIAAGAPLEAIEDPVEQELRDLFPSADDLYLLEVRGDSMIDDHIQSGDLVLVRRNRPPANGDIVVAILENEEATLKRLYREPGGGYRLQPASSSHSPILVDHLEIRGVVVGIHRRL